MMDGVEIDDFIHSNERNNYNNGDGIVHYSSSFKWKKKIGNGDKL